MGVSKTYPVSSNIDPRLHCPRCGPCIILAGRDEAPNGSECATSSISSTDGPPRLVLRFDSILGACLKEGPIALVEASFEVSAFGSLVPSESDPATSDGPCPEPELSLRKRPMIDFGCFGFSIPPEGCCKEAGEEEKKQMRNVHRSCRSTQTRSTNKMDN